MAEWSNAPDSKSGIQFLLYRGFESLSLRHKSNKNNDLARIEPPEGGFFSSLPRQGA
jgi:hypothetical protein